MTFQEMITFFVVGLAFLNLGGRMLPKAAIQNGIAGWLLSRGHVKWAMRIKYLGNARR